MGLNYCPIHAWEELKVHWSEYLFVIILLNFLLILVMSGTLTIWGNQINKRELFAKGYDKEKIEKFVGTFQHIDYSDLVDDKDIQRFYKQFYGGYNVRLNRKR